MGSAELAVAFCSDKDCLSTSPICGARVNRILQVHQADFCHLSGLTMVNKSGGGSYHNKASLPAVRFSPAQ